LFDVVITKSGPHMIPTILAILSLAPMGLRYAKELAEMGRLEPQFVLKGVALTVAQAAVIRLQDSDIQAEVIRHTSARSTIENTGLGPGPEFMAWVEARQRVRAATAALRTAREDSGEDLNSIPAVAELEETLQAQQAEEWAVYRTLVRGD